MQSVDVTGFEDVLGLKINPLTGEAFKGTNVYKDENLTTVWEPTDFFFHNGYVVGPGVRQKLGYLAFAKKETADKVAAFISNRVAPQAKISIVPAVWSVFKTVDESGTPFDQLQIAISQPGFPTVTLNAGLIANQIIRSGPDFAAEIIKTEVY